MMASLDLGRGRIGVLQVSATHAGAYAVPDLVFLDAVGAAVSAALRQAPDAACAGK